MLSSSFILREESRNNFRSSWQFFSWRQVSSSYLVLHYMWWITWFSSLLLQMQMPVKTISKVNFHWSQSHKINQIINFFKPEILCTFSWLYRMKRYTFLRLHLLHFILVITTLQKIISKLITSQIFVNFLCMAGLKPVDLLYVSVNDQET